MMNESSANDPLHMFAKELTRDGHTRRFTISATGGVGWELRVEHDSELLRRVSYTDWHRVERALAGFSVQVSELQQDGWRETPGPRSQRSHSE